MLEIYFKLLKVEYRTTYMLMITVCQILVRREYYMYALNMLSSYSIVVDAPARSFKCV